MKLSNLAYGLFGVTSFAFSTRRTDSNGCLTQDDANLLIARYAAVIAQQDSDLGNATVTALAITAPGFSEISDSANIQIGVPLGSVTVPTQEAFVVGSQTNPPVVFETIGVFVANCRYVLWQWVSYQFGSGEYEVKGFHLFVLGADGKLLEALFEFNSIAGALNTGYTVIAPDGTEL